MQVMEKTVIALKSSGPAEEVESLGKMSWWASYIFYRMQKRKRED